MPHTHDLTIERDVVRKRFVSWERGEAEREWLGLTVLHEAAPGLGPEPVALERDGDAPVVVMSRVPGETLGGAPVTRRQTRDLARALRRLFDAACPLGLAERDYGPSTMRAEVRDWIAEDVDLAPCRDAGLVTDAVVAARTHVARGHEHDRVVDPVLALGDGNLDNLMWDGSAVRIVDFEEFGLSDPAFETADLVEHASSRLGRLLDVDAMVDHLPLDQEQRDRLTTHRRVLACFWLTMLLPGHGGFLRNPPGSAEDQARHVLALLP